MNNEKVETIEQNGPDHSENERYMRDIECETCLYADHCDGWEYAPYCMAKL